MGVTVEEKLEVVLVEEALVPVLIVVHDEDDIEGVGVGEAVGANKLGAPVDGITKVAVSLE